MKTQRKYDPYSQRSYKLGIMIISNIYRVLNSLQSFFLGECYNAIDHRYYPFSIFPECAGN